jgi:S-adenosyl-L-methionine hydrolase (adenosine-forming)
MTVVTFTTDFGTVDGYVGAMKGVVLSLAPEAVLVDITHHIPRHDIAAGAFALAQAAPLFPPGTVHVAVVDPGVGGRRSDIVVEASGALYVGPDNGVLALAARGPRVAHRIERADFQRAQVSPTFHGRDVFAQTAGRLARGAHPRDVGPLLTAIEELPMPGRAGDGDRDDDLDDPAATAGDSAFVVHVDAFGNLITSWPGDRLAAGASTLDLCGPAAGARFRVQAVTTYADVAPGQLLIYVGSAGFVEIAVREGSAAVATGLARGDRIRLEQAR